MIGQRRCNSFWYTERCIFVSIESDEIVQILFQNHEPDTNSIIKMQFNAKIYIIRSWWMDIFCSLQFSTRLNSVQPNQIK